MKCMRYLLYLSLAAFLFSSCSAGSGELTASPNAKRYPLKGKVVSVDKAAKRAKVDHEKIEGFMDRMTMDFPVKGDWVWSELNAGAEISAELVVDSTAKDPYWLENVAITSAPKPGQPEPPVNEDFAQIGNVVPNFALTDQDGKKFNFDRYRGKALAITFIYARCPLPDYCIKMSTAFSDLALQVMKDPEAAKNIRLLSISFDPANDTPEKLRSYGLGYLGKDAKPDFTVWQLAVGPDEEVKKVADFFGLRYEVDQNDETQYVHSLRTAVIGPDGKLRKIFTGGDWTVSQLREELESSLKPQ